MRVVGGLLRGRRLEAPSVISTRPTTDRVRESLFNVLKAFCIKRIGIIKTSLF